MEIMKFARQLIGKLPFFSDESEKVKVKKEITIVGGLESTASAAASYPRPILVDSSGLLQVDIAADSTTAGIVTRWPFEADGEQGLAGNVNSTNDIGSAGQLWMVQIAYSAAAARNANFQEEDTAINIAGFMLTAAGVEVHKLVYMEGGQKILAFGNAGDTWDFKAWRVY